MTENLLDDHHALRGVFLFMFLQGHSSNEARRTMCEVKKLRCDLSLSILTREPTTDLIKKIITGDEKWVLYVNHTRKRQWVPAGEAAESDPKGELHEKKIMLSIWWDSAGVIYRELLPDSTTINSDVYCSQMDNVLHVYRSHRPRSSKIILLHDNAKPHTSLKTRSKLQSLGIEVLPHSPYSPDLAPTDYHFFRSLQNHLSGEKFNDRKDVEKFLDHFFASKSPEFYANGIAQLPMRWQEVINSNGEYISY
ncbi:hypothetical protein L5515_004175 [Caenorhabditis briggsae]|uniref:Mos1 transposase HTH domain-containing protein n=2 Tax=Caenorhabditis briggsae TaxID=6238 RepID=A0AAE9EGU7_CAEBR|nr:hypothetical protein L5515_004175 [Caenorhabditis briggsae]